jgi:carbon-monoxide dehydrogenase medium subunit
MLLAPVDYYRPDSVSEAVAALRDNPGGRVLAGGQSLISILKLRAASVDLLVDVSRLEEIRSITTLRDGSVRIGAGVTYDEMAHSPELIAAMPAVARVAGHTVDAQVRNRGTFGGNLCHNDPINNFPPLVVALGATMHATGPDGDRTVAADDFFTGYFSNALEQPEMLTSVTLPALDDRSIGYQEIEVGEAAARAVAVVASDNGTITEANVVLGCLPVPTRLDAVGQALQGPATFDAVAAATSTAGDDIDPLSDPDASSEYRRAMAPVVAKRAVMEALAITGPSGGHHGE